MINALELNGDHNNNNNTKSNNSNSNDHTNKWNMYNPTSFQENEVVVSLFNGISTLCRLFNAKAILLEEQ